MVPIADTVYCLKSRVPTLSQGEYVDEVEIVSRPPTADVSWWNKEKIENCNDSFKTQESDNKNKSCWCQRKVRIWLKLTRSKRITWSWGRYVIVDIVAWNRLGESIHGFWVYELILGLDHRPILAYVILLDPENLCSAQDAPERQAFLSHCHLDCSNKTLTTNNLKVKCFH